MPARCQLCPTCGRTHYGRHEYCSPACAQIQAKRKTKKRTKRERAARGVYTKDLDLYAQRMQYTLDGITWWATPCCYCGDPATDDEHVLPVAAYQKLFAVGNVTIPDDLLRLVPACGECNRFAGDKVFRSFEEKRLYIKTRLGRKYHRTVDLPYWAPEDIETLEGRMQEWIRSGQNLRDILFERLRF